MAYLGTAPAEAYSPTAVKDSFNGDGSTVAFTMSQPSKTNDVRVVVENVVQDPTVAYSCSGTTITFTSAPPVGTANVYVVHLGLPVQSIVPPDEINIATTYTTDLTVQGDLTASANAAVTGNLTVDTSTLHVDAANNRVGVGTASPSAPLQVQGSAGEIRLQRPTSTQADWSLKLPSSGGELTFYDNNNTAERARIDSSGNLLVGKTASDNGATVGIELQGGVSKLYVTDDASSPMVLNRLSSDGHILNFQKDGTTVGRLGSQVYTGSSRTLYIQGESTAGFRFDPSRIIPFKNGSIIDNALDVGDPSFRWDDIYATNGTIQTSDANEKQQIASLTDAEIIAAKAISKLFKTFKWNDKVAEKGDAARTHTGVIAQEVQQAMTDAGLDAGNYAFFISSTWWEADETYTDDDGVEQTRTNTYDTAEEAPANATERNRKGIRYPELLSFIGAATEQRLTSIEARLATLENA
jgi:hypothetical protein